jgi:hypothetical protein
VLGKVTNCCKCSALHLSIRNVAEVLSDVCVQQATQREEMIRSLLGCVVPSVFLCVSAGKLGNCD